MMSWLPPPSTGPKVVLGCTGSVATIKVPELARRLQERGASVVIVPTERACHFLRCQAKVDSMTRSGAVHGGSSGFIKPEKKIADNGELRGSDSEEQNSSSDQCSHCGRRTPIRGGMQTDNSVSALKSLYPDLNFVLETDEWAAWNGRGDPVLHIQLRDWAQVMLISPLDANTMAKIAQGLCDNLLTCIVRAWDAARPLVFCPAMNTHMYKHPLTMRHTSILKELGYIEVCVVSKRLACGDVGPGAMAELDNIVNAVMQELPGAHRVSHGPF
ncbi:phosphopantothenoylcysteine decarboxylase subunit SIS2-like [Homarus americanus]|uniref:Phosphopantothenoylcysteine decarboxylase-like n=1 Tax=Homarus americanus TaxID=6706 RepID=A0A8J5JAN0_HOMAM|nr:phosphopantothenoylcysteine decarboxylase subunit SIS2-like [Homarus americanus]KAG7155252.1 Phosphopantothenoylcysteine decarboxylase-like [Homarus americanus]